MYLCLIKSKEPLDSYREPTEAHKTYQEVLICPTPLQGANSLVSQAEAVNVSLDSKFNKNCFNI